MEYLRFIIIIALTAAIIVKTATIIVKIKKNGFKGAMLGGRILYSSKEIKHSMRGHIIVHTLKNKGRIIIALELSEKDSSGCHDVTDIHFHREDALSLVAALTLALENKDSLKIGNNEFKGEYFGVRTLYTSKEVKHSGGSSTRGHIKVHTLEDKGRISIGLEVVQKSESYGIHFHREDALSLVTALTLALKNTDQGGVINSESLRSST